MGESSACCSEESWCNDHDEREGRQNLDAPIHEVESLHRLTKAELRDQEGPLPATIHRPNPGPLLLSWRIFGLQPDCYPPRKSREDNVHLSFWHLRLQSMPFGLCNAPATFQRCITAIFSDFLADSLEVFMDNFSVFRNNFKSCLAHLTKILEVCVRKRLLLSWEKFHFMVREGVVLGHIVSGKGLEVDKAKREVIQNLRLPSIVKDLRSFLGHVDFYWIFIQDFAKFSKPLTTLICKDKDFIIDEEGKRAFTMLKQALIEAPILQSPNWDLPFEIMCEASDYAVGAVLGKDLTRSRRPSSMQVRP